MIEVIGGMCVAARRDGLLSNREQTRTHNSRPRVWLMKKNDLSEAASNLLIFSSVTVALMPFLLGDQLIPFLNGFMKDGGALVDQVTSYVMWLFS